MRSFFWSTPRLVVFCVLFFCGASRAQNTAPGPLTMEVASPLSLTEKPLAIQARQGRWIPIAVTFSNTGEPVKGTLNLRLLTATVDDNNPTQFFTEVDLPTNARKRVWLYGRIERDDVDKFEISFQGRGFKSMKADGVVQVAAPETRIVLTISDSDEKLSYLSGIKGPGLGLPLETAANPNMPPGDYAPGASNPNLNMNAMPVRPLGAPHDLIPSRSIGLDAVDLVILQDFPHTALTPIQVAALKNYAASGGAVLALGGANWQRLSTSPLAELWPVDPQSSGTASGDDVSILINRFARFPVMTGADRLGGAPVVSTRARLRPGCRVLLGNAAAPILAVNDFGAGQILFLAVDPTQPPFLGWRGHTRMWADIFRPTSRPPQIVTVGERGFDEDDYPYGQVGSAMTTATDGLLESLKTSKQLKTPPVSVIAWFLALYVFFLVPVNYVVLRYFDRRELAWLTIPIIVLAFSVMSYAAALRIKGTAILTRQVNLVQTSDGSRYARADAMLWLFSPRKTTYDISSKDPQMVVGDYLSDENVSVSIREPEENQAFALDGAPINMWDWRSFVGHSTTDLKGGVRAIVQNGKVGIVNGSPFDLKGVVLVCDNKVLGFRTVKAGATSFKVDTSKPGPAGIGNPAGSGTSQLAARIRSAAKLESEFPKNQVGGFETIPSKLWATAAMERGGAPATFLTAWSDRSFAGLTIGREDARAQNLTLLVVRIENDKQLRAALQQSNTAPEVRVQKMSSETLPLAPGKQAGTITIYEAQLNSSKTERITIDLKIAFQDSDNYGAPNNFLPKTPRLEVFDFERGDWRAVSVRDLEAEKINAIKLQLSSRPVPKAKPQGSAPPGGALPVAAPIQNSWQLIAVLSGSLARAAVLQPDNRLQFRVRTFHDDANIQQTNIHLGDWKPIIPKPVVPAPVAPGAPGLPSGPPGAPPMP